MHEASAVRAAIEGAVRGWAPDAPAGHLELEVRDPTRAEVEAVVFYAETILRDLGYGGVTFTVRGQPMTCSSCGALVHPSPREPLCTACEAPLRRLEGPAVTCLPSTRSGPGRPSGSRPISRTRSRRAPAGRPDSSRPDGPGRPRQSTPCA